VFDPFGDYATRGYLRNRLGISDLDDIKVLEHANFRSNLEEALGHLRSVKGPIRYAHFLKVHAILFGDLYPWAGRDRHQLGVETFINKGSVQFEAPQLIEQAMAHALDEGNNRKKMQDRPGYIMGMLAWAHPFLDGNGRTMLLVHMELCHRAGYAIDWANSSKQEYLDALTKEIEQPRNGSLDQYMLCRKRDPVAPEEWHQLLIDIPGLDGLDELGESQVYSADDEDAKTKYAEATARRSKSTRPA
jgi:cell filamentation protein